MKRLTKELKDLQGNPPPGILVEEAEQDMKWYTPSHSLTPSWKIRINAAQDTIYSGEVFWLRFKFSENYPLDSPEVVFIQHIPIHPHVTFYS